MAFQLKNSFVALILLLTLYSSSSASAQTAGIATFYTPPYVPSACNGFQDDGVWIAAMSKDLYRDGAACGELYEVSCVGGTNEGTPLPCWDVGAVTVTIVDLCPPESCHGDIDLSYEAFNSIANVSSGGIQIVYKRVN